MASCAEPSGYLQVDGARQLDLGRLRNFVGFRLKRFHSRFLQEFEFHAPEVDLRPGPLSTLALVESNPGITQSRLSRELGQLQNVTVQIVDQLEAEGLAERRKSPTDRRCHELHVTANGRRKLEEYFHAVQAAEQAALLQMTMTDRQELDDLLGLISAPAEPRGG